MLFRNKTKKKRTPLRWIFYKLLLVLISYFVVLFGLSVWEFCDNRFSGKVDYAAAFELEGKAPVNLSLAAKDKVIEYLNTKQIPSNHVRHLEILVSSFDFFREGACGSYFPKRNQVWLNGAPHPWRSGLLHEIGHRVYGELLTDRERENFKATYDSYAQECAMAMKHVEQTKKQNSPRYRSLCAETLAFVAPHNESDADGYVSDDYDERFAVIYAAYFAQESTDAASSFGALKFRCLFASFIEKPEDDEEEVDAKDFTFVVPHSLTDIPSLVLYYDRMFLGLSRWVIR